MYSKLSDSSNASTFTKRSIFEGISSCCCCCCCCCCSCCCSFCPSSSCHPPLSCFFFFFLLLLIFFRTAYYHLISQKKTVRMYGIKIINVRILITFSFQSLSHKLSYSSCALSCFSSLFFRWFFINSSVFH